MDEEQSSSAPADGEKPDANAEKKAAPTVSTQLVRRAKARYRFLLGDEGTPYAVTRSPKSPNVALPLRGRDSVRQRLARDYYATSKAVPSGAALADALAVLEGEAAAKPRESVALRLARHDDSIVLDLGDPDGRHVIVRPGSWTYPRAGERSPVLFRRTALTGRLPAPNRGTNVETLANLVNAETDTVRLLIAWLVAALIPEIPHPILAVFGEQGTAKTTLMRLLATLIDPSPAPTRTAPRDLGQWAVTASGSWLIALDNLSSMPDWLSDALCRAVTGDALTTRALYSDSDIHVMQFRRLIALTSIDAGALRGDLGERLLPIELQRIPPNRRRTDAEIAEQFAAAAPGLLGGLLDLLADVLDVLPDVHPTELSRMADFCRVLAAVDQVAGWDTTATYQASTTDIAESVVEADPFATALRDLGGFAEGTAAELLEKLTTSLREKPPRGWPRTPRGAAGALKRVTPALRELGWTVTHGRRAGGNRDRTIMIAGPAGADDRPDRPNRPGLPADLGERRDGCDPPAEEAGTVREDPGTVGTPAAGQPSRIGTASDQRERDSRDDWAGRGGSAPGLETSRLRDVWRGSGLPVGGGC